MATIARSAGVVFIEQFIFCETRDARSRLTLMR
jgi:hypothetical protein